MGTVASTTAAVSASASNECSAGASASLAPARRSGKATRTVPDATYTGPLASVASAWNPASAAVPLPSRATSTTSAPTSTDTTNCTSAMSPVSAHRTPSRSTRGCHETSRSICSGPATSTSPPTAKPISAPAGPHPASTATALKASRRRDLEDRGDGVAGEPQLALQPALRRGHGEQHERPDAGGQRDVPRGERRGDPAGEQARDEAGGDRDEHGERHPVATAARAARVPAHQRGQRKRHEGVRDDPDDPDQHLRRRVLRVLLGRQQVGHQQRAQVAEHADHPGRHGQQRAVLRDLARRCGRDLQADGGRHTAPGPWTRFSRSGSRAGPTSRS